jgi:integrase
MTPKLAAHLREYKAERESLCLHLGHLLRPDDLVFASIEGRPIDPSVLSHNFASLMLLNGVAPKIISEALGHASVAFTMDVYSHILPGMQEEAMALLDRILPEGKNGGVQKP